MAFLGKENLPHNTPEYHHKRMLWELEECQYLRQFNCTESREMRTRALQRALKHRAQYHRLRK